MKFLLFTQILTSVVLLSSCFSLLAAEGTEEHPKKTLYLPEKIGRVPDNNDFYDSESKFNYKHMIESENVAIFWDKAYGDDPMKNADSNQRFDVRFLSSECERIFNYYVDTLKMVEKGNSLTDKYKMIVIIFSDEKDLTAYGGGEAEKVGVLWTPAQRINKFPYGTLAHELGHSFQYISAIDAGAGPRGPIMEMSAQYMLWQVYPNWMTFENYHLTDFMKQTNYAFLHPINMYHSPYVIEYWSEKHGKDFLGKLCRSTKEGEDPVTAYKRLNNLTQEQFNDEMFDASRRFITWDLKRVEEVAKQYANQHYTKLNEEKNGWYRIDSAKCPQNYGYNGIKLKVPSPGTRVQLNFKGIAGAEGYSLEKIEKAGWRYGFVASLKDGSRVYGGINREKEGKTTFKVPENTEYLWLVVSGAPTEHWPIAMRRGRSKGNAPKDEQWPYRIKLKGTKIDSGFVEPLQ